VEGEIIGMTENGATPYMRRRKNTTIDKKIIDNQPSTIDSHSAVKPFNIPLSEGVAESRGRLPGEAHEPLPPHRRLYNPYLRPYADTLRKHMTKAEVYLWNYVLRAGQMKGYTFNRQRPVLRYIADFMCKPLHLIIEVDGSIHDVEEVKKHDTFRQAELEACGFTVLRFSNDEVIRSIDSVRSAILEQIAVLEKSVLRT
jgi:very-short-patch-repair endonuclease